MPSLSVLIPTIETREHYLARLLEVLAPQRVQGVEILTLCDDGELPIGAKRNRLVSMAAGDYLCFIDDDDLVVPQYVARLLAALAPQPDCVGINAMVWVDGVPTVRPKVMSLRHAFRVVMPRQGDGGLDRIEQPITHLCPIRSDIARRVPFPETNKNEDLNYAMNIRGLLTAETFVDDILYHYYFRTIRPNERTNELLARCK